MPDTLSPATIAFDQVLRLPLRTHRQVLHNGRLVQVLDRDSRVLAVLKNAAEPKEAIATLFAMAPEMKEALEELVRWSRESGPDHVQPGPVQRAIAAIAKAEGRSNG